MTDFCLRMIEDAIINEFSKWFFWNPTSKRVRETKRQRQRERERAYASSYVYFGREINGTSWKFDGQKTKAKRLTGKQKGRPLWTALALTLIYYEQLFWEQQPANETRKNENFSDHRVFFFLLKTQSTWGEKTRRKKKMSNICGSYNSHEKQKE